MLKEQYNSSSTKKSHIHFFFWTYDKKYYIIKFEQFELANELAPEIEQ